MSDDWRIDGQPADVDAVCGALKSGSCITITYDGISIGETVTDYKAMTSSGYRDGFKEFDNCNIHGIPNIKWCGVKITEDGPIYALASDTIFVDKDYGEHVELVNVLIVEDDSVIGYRFVCCDPVLYKNGKVKLTWGNDEIKRMEQDGYITVGVWRNL